MLDINERNVNLLFYILKHEVLSIKTLAEILDLSSKTIQKEIQNINHYFDESKRNLTIVNQSNLISIRFDGENGHSQKQQLHNEINILYDYPHLLKIKPRILDMMWYLLKEQGYIRSDTLIEKFAISNSTLTASLRQIRHIFARYDLSIDSTPYYGMRVCGSKISRIACLLEYCDCYSEQENLYFHSIAQTYFSKNKHPIKDKQYVIHLINQNLHLNLNEDGFRMLNKLLPIIGFLKDVEDDALNCDWINPRFHDQILKFLKSNQALKSTIATGPEILTFFIFIVMVHDISLSKTHFISEKFSQDCQVILNYLDKQIREQIGIAFIDNEQLSDIILSTIVRITLNNRYQVKRYYASNQAMELIQSFPGTKVLALTIIYQLYPSSGDAIICDLVFALYNVILKVPNHYKATSALLINQFNNLAVDSVIEKLTLDKYNVRYTIISPAELFTLKLKDYDYIFNLGHQLITLATDEQDKVFEIPYLVEAETKKKVWEQLTIKQRSQQFLEHRFRSSCMIKIETFNESVVSEILFESLIAYNLYTELDYLKLLVKYAFTDRSHHETILLIFDHRIKETINFKYIIVDNTHQNYTIDVMVLPTHNQLTLIKQADSVVRRIQSGEIAITNKQRKNYETKQRKYNNLPNIS